MKISVLDIKDSVRHQTQGLTPSDVRYIEGIFVVKLRAQNIDTHFSIHNYLWMKVITILKKILMISITGKQWKKYTMLVWKMVVSLLMMFICLVMDVLCLNILSFCWRFRYVSGVTTFMFKIFWWFSWIHVI